MEKIHQNINIPVPQVRDFEGVNKYIFDMSHAIQQLMTGDIYIESGLYVNKFVTIYQGGLILKELATDPADPAAGTAVIWLNTSGELWMKHNDGTMIKSGIIGH